MHYLKRTITLVVTACILLSGCKSDTDTGKETTIKKPVIYLYGYDEDVTVKINPQRKIKFLCTYPEYNDGWTVSAKPDGHLTDSNGTTYKYLYWEGEGELLFRDSEGFCVPGNETAKFLEEKLTTLGLNEDERNDFIVYWLPQMQNNNYNIIAFHTKDYEDVIPMSVNPAPKNTLRIFMTWYPWSRKLYIKEQTLTKKECDRTKPTIVEWGGMQTSNFISETNYKIPPIR